MDIALGVALYLMIWWLTLFAVLPFGVKTQGESGTVVPGTPESAPMKPRIVRVFLINTVVATIVFLIVSYAVETDWFGYVPPPPGPETQGK